MTEKLSSGQIFRAPIFYLLSICLVSASLFVFYDQDIIKETKWLSQLVLATLAISGVGTLFWRFTKLNFTASSIILFVTIGSMFGFFSEIFSVLLFWATTYLIGRICLPRELNPGAFSVLLSLSIGHALMLFILAICVYFGVFFVSVLSAISILSFGIFCLRKIKSPFDEFVTTTKSGEIEVYDVLAVFSALCVMSLLFLMALQPDTGSDSVNAYRPMLLQIMETGRLEYDPEVSSVRMQPLFAVWTHAYSVVISQSDYGAKIMNVSYLLAAFYVLIQVSTHQYKRGALLALAANFSVPLIAYTTISAFYDNTSFFQVGIFLVLCVLYYREELPKYPEAPFIFALGLTAAALILSKLTMIYAVPAIAIFYVYFAWGAKAGIANIMKNSVFIAVLAIVPAIIFFGFAYHQTGSPVFPYYNEVFESPYYPKENFVSFHTGYFSPKLLWDLTFNTSEYAQAGSTDGQIGIFGVSIFLSLLALAFFRSRLLFISLVGCLITTIIVSVLQNSPRYLYAAFIFLFFCLTEIFREPGKFFSFLLSGAITVVNFMLLPNFGSGSAPLSASLKVNHRAVVSNRRPMKHVSDVLSDRLGPNGRVLFMTQNGGFSGTGRELSWYDAKAYGRFVTLTVNDPARIAEFLNDFNIDAVVLGPKGIDFLYKFELEPVFEELERVASRSETYNGITTYYIKPEYWADEIVTLEDQTSTNRVVLTRLSDFNVAELVFKYKCDGRASVLATTKEPEINLKAQAVTLICDGTENDASVVLRSSNLNEVKNVTLAVLNRDGEIDLKDMKVFSR